MKILKKFMHYLSGMMPEDSSGENSRAVKAFNTLLSLRDSFHLKKRREKVWPAVAGHYRVGNSKSPFAVCTLTSFELAEPLSKMNHVAIAGRIYTPNLGIEKIILNIIGNPNIRYLLLCGKESSVFHPGQAIKSLFSSGIDPDKRINHAIGHYPVLDNLGLDTISDFLQQVELIDCSGETDLSEIREKMESVIGSQVIAITEKRVRITSNKLQVQDMGEKFKEIKPGGKPLKIPADKKGFFIITVNQTTKHIVVKHFYSNHQPGHMIKGHSAQSILHALIREKLISELSHAGYLGAELTKAEASIKLNLDYEQDRPLKLKPG